MEDKLAIIPEAKKVGSYVKMEDLWVEWVAAQPPMGEFKVGFVMPLFVSGGGFSWKCHWSLLV